MNENNEVMNEQQANGANAATYATALGLMGLGAVVYECGKALWSKVIKPMFVKKVDTDTVVVEVETSEE